MHQINDVLWPMMLRAGELCTCSPPWRCRLYFLDTGDVYRAGCTTCGAFVWRNDDDKRVDVGPGRR